VYQRIVRVLTPSIRLACSVLTQSDALVLVTAPTVRNCQPLSANRLNCPNPVSEPDVTFVQGEPLAKDEAEPATEAAGH
jgi:hypothetical protein